MTTNPKLAMAAIASAVVLAAAAVGCAGNESATTSSSSASATSSSQTPTTSKGGGATSTTPQSTDYTQLLIKVSDIPGTKRWSADPPTLNPDGQPGAKGLFRNASGSGAIAVVIQVLASAAQAPTALDAGKKALPDVVTGTPSPIDVGTGGTLVQGKTPDGKKSMTVLLFTEGKAFVDMTFASGPDDPAPLDKVIDLGRKQDTYIRDGLPS